MYPSGTPSSPGIVSRGQRIVVANPFAGHFVHVEAQIRVNSRWGWAGHYTDYNNGNYWNHFVSARQLLPDDTIIVQTSNHGITAQSAETGSPFGEFSTYLISAPYRLVVTKLGKIS